MTVKGGKKCHICLVRKRYTFYCKHCGHNTCFNAYCAENGMCLKCQMDPEHRTVKEVQLA